MIIPIVILVQAKLIDESSKRETIPPIPQITIKHYVYPSNKHVEESGYCLYSKYKIEYRLKDETLFIENAEWNKYPVDKKRLDAFNDKIKASKGLDAVSFTCSDRTIGLTVFSQKLKDLNIPTNQSVTDYENIILPIDMKQDVRVKPR